MRAIRDYPTPCSLDEVNCFLYMMSYMRQFIHSQADLALSMKRAATLEPKETWQCEPTGRHDKTGKRIWKPHPVIRWEWGDYQQKSIDDIKCAITINATFGGRDDVQYHLTTDTLKTGIGGVLFQLLDSPPGVIAIARNKKTCPSSCLCHGVWSQQKGTTRTQSEKHLLSRASSARSSG